MMIRNIKRPYIKIVAVSAFILILIGVLLSDMAFAFKFIVMGFVTFAFFMFIHESEDDYYEEL